MQASAAWGGLNRNLCSPAPITVMSVPMMPPHDGVIGGVDTHTYVHAVAALSPTGQPLGTALFPTTSAGHLASLRSHGQVIRAGVERTGSCGAGLMRHLRANGIDVVEVNRPNRRLRRRRQRSKFDTVAPIPLDRPEEHQCGMFHAIEVTYSSPARLGHFVASDSSATDVRERHPLESPFLQGPR